MKKILSLVLVVVLLLTAITGTLAYFTDTDSADNVFTVGNIDIELRERNGESENALEDEEYRDWLKEQTIMPGETLPKLVTVKNVGSEDAYIRVTITIPDEMEPVWPQFGDTWSCGLKEGTTNTWVITSTQAVAGKTETPALLKEMKLKGDVDESDPSSYNVKVEVEAIQAAGFDGNSVAAYLALDAAQVVTADNVNDANDALSNGKNVKLSENLSSNSPIVVNGATLDGNGKKINREAGEAENNGGIMITSGTIKNVTVTGEASTSGKGFRAVYAHGMTGDVTIEKATLTGSYAINADGSAGKLTVKDSKLDGWVSYDVESGSFTNCEFVTVGADVTASPDGEVNTKTLRFYCDTTLTDCTFTEGYNFDNADNETVEVVMNNCYSVNGTTKTLITVDNYKTLLSVADMGSNATLIINGVTVK